VLSWFGCAGTEQGAAGLAVRGRICGVGVVNSLWRAIAVFRIGALAYSVYRIAEAYREYERPMLGWSIAVAMGVWTAITAWGFAAESRRGWPLLAADLVVTATALYASEWVIDARLLDRGAPTLTMAWVAAPVLTFAVAKGRLAAASAALALGTVDGLLRGFASEVVLNGLVLLLLAGLVMGYLRNITAAAERRMQQAVELEAAHRERERLARTIHDSVLQALALIARRGTELGGEAADLGRLAGEQGAVLRTLVGVGPVEPATTGDVDLRATLGRYSSAQVSVAVPATPVHLPAGVANEVDAAVAAALDNVAAHAGTGGRAFLLIEDEADAVTVTVRDGGLGMAPGRLVEAAAAGRLGVAQSIRGRIRDVGGAVTITSAPGAGTEVEMRLPRSLVAA
jgi:signal transduction histidine kinase